ncbi:MAG: hypothetical protein HYW23_00430 [Candidatus Aenigmarchaeota archaeon]|nr:hypothetical protein [Candidatus Aenigmarchaeota archaeon]
MSKHVLTKIGVLSFAKISGILYAIMGLIAGLFYGLFFSAWGMMMAFYSVRMFPTLFLWLVMIIILPVFYGVFGFLCGALMAWLYNIIAGWVGGIEYNTK